MAVITVTNPRRFFLFLLVILIGVGGLVLWLAWGDATIQRSGEVVIAPGEPAGAVWEKIVEDGFTNRSLPWRYYSWRSNAATAIQAGTYQIEQGEAVARVVQRFVEGDTVPDELTITYPEGFTLQQIAERTAGRGVGSVEAFRQAAHPAAFVQQYSFLSDLPAERSLEGYLFPDTYRVFPDDGPEDVIKRMLANFDRKVVQAGLTAEALAQAGRTMDEIVIMASIIEREVIRDEDMALVSGILWKRFDDGVGLDADATVRYALDKWDEALTVEDLQIDSLYNTRRYRGLPPGPISNPGLRALVAAVRPQDSEFYYYLSAPDGQTIFSRTLNEHNQNKATYLQ